MKKHIQATTVSVECADRDAINQLAEELDLSQRQMVTRLIESYRATLAQTKEAEGHDPPEEILERLAADMEKVLKRDDRIISFIREQEKVLHKPILHGVQSIEAQLKTLTDILSNLE